MTPELQEFLDRLDLYGGRLEDWPAEARAAAETLIEGSAEARAQWNAMRRAEAALLQSQTSVTGDANTIAARAVRSAQYRPQQAAIRQLPWAVAAVMAIIAGVYVGQLATPSEGPTEIVTAALDQSGATTMFGERTSVLTVACAVSVLLNLFLAGVIVGRITLPGFGPPGQSGLVPRQEIRALPDAERRAFIRVMHSHQAEMRTLHEHVRDAQRAAEDAVGAPAYDRKLLETRFAAVRQAQEAQGAAQSEAVIDALGTLSPASRAELARKAEENAENGREPPR